MTKHVFVATRTSLVDPIDNDPSISLLNGPATTTDQIFSPREVRPVQGVAADGTTEVVIRIPAISVGDQFILTVMNDQQPPIQSTLVTEDGIRSAGSTNFSLHQINVTAQSAGNVIPEAFAVYRPR